MEILIHATNYNRTHQSIMSELYGMYEDVQEKELTEEEKNYSMVNDKYMEKDNNELYQNVTKAINDIGAKVNKINFPVFNVHPFPDKRIFLVDNCANLDDYRNKKVGKEIIEFYDEFDKKFGNIISNFTQKPLEYFRSYDKMKSVTDHFVCDYDNKKDLSPLEKMGLNLSEFYDYSKRFYGHFIFNYFVDEYTSGLEKTHLMQDFLGYMDRRIANHPHIAYKAPKMVIDFGHDTTVGPISRFMDSVFHKGYHKYCEFACNVYFELYKENGNDKYTVDYYLDDEKLISGMDYNEFKNTMQKHFWNETFTNEFCGVKEETKNTTEDETNLAEKKELEKQRNIYLILSIIFAVLFIIITTVAIILLKKMKTLQNERSEKLMGQNEIKGSELPTLS